MRPGDGEMARRIRAVDWAGTPLGPMSAWSAALRHTVELILHNRFPMLLWWGPEFVQLYNDAYAPIPGAKHPNALGQPAKECWPEIWHIIGPMIEAPFSGAPATTADDLELLIDRQGFLEETHFKIAYSPVPDDTVPGTRVGGVLATVAETTEQVFVQRQLRTLRELGAHATEARSATAACDSAATTLCENVADIPFALFYLLEADGSHMRLAASCGFAESAGEANPTRIDLGADDTRTPWRLAHVLRTNAIEVDTELRARFTHLPTGRWSELPHTAVLVPLSSPDQERPYGVLVVGCSPHRMLDETYRTFFELIANQVLFAIRNARAHEEQRRRAEALAELDRAKTIFFSNVSHEFRTPLTLMLGPIEDLLGGDGAELTPESRNQVEVVHRNSLRLLKLVNTMLDFSRLEAGRIAASFEPVDLPAYTAELASNFRSACERAGVELVIDCPPLPADAPRAYVDRDMWEKIVLNLLSNAFKFTLAGSITVRLEPAPGGTVRLTVADTGVGIPAEALPRVFERFHRVREVRGRTHEGTGIGLALVQELAKLHGGTAAVESVLGRGSTFSVTIPLGRTHLDPARVHAASPLASTRTGAHAFVEEAIRWLPGDAPEAAFVSSLHERDDGFEADDATGARPRVLWADDNADMREYVARLLGERFEVETVADGQAALEAARRQPPDVILTDVMMPRLDGFGLLRELRADPALRTVPVIMLSARAGEESRIEGVEAGADDYLVKPFTARELLARVDAHARMARFRRDADWFRRTSEAELARANDELARRVAELEQVNAQLREARQAAFQLMDDAIRIKDDVRYHRDQLETLANLAPVGFFLADAELRLLHVNPIAIQVLGELATGVIGRSFEELIHQLFPAAYADQVVQTFRHTLATGEPHVTPELEQYRIDLGTVEYYEWRLHRITLPDGRYGLACYFRDIRAEVEARREREDLLEAAERANKAKDEFLAILSHELRSPMNAILGWIRVLKSASTRDPKLVDRAVETIERNVWTQAQIVNDLLDVSRIMSGKFQLEIERVDLSSVVMGAVESFRFSADGKGIGLMVDIEREGLDVMGDPNRLQQVVSNLVGNAIKFTDAGGFITVSARSDGQYLELTVADTGQGIDPEFAPLIFERFRQANSSSARKHGGLGLGLAIVKSVVELHGGMVKAESEGPGKGTRFTVRVPRAPARIAFPLPQPASKPPEDHIRPLDVLVVEDDADTREALELVLEEYGAHVRSAASVQEAIDAYESRPPDLMISDIGMPDEDGYVLIRAIREREESNSHRTLAIAMTGFAGRQDREMALRAGFDEHVGKPVEPAALFERVRVLDAARRAGDRAR